MYFSQSSVLKMPTERYGTSKKLFIQTINNLFILLDPTIENNKRHVDDNRLTLTKEQSQVRMNNLLIFSCIWLNFVVMNLILISSFSNNAKQGVYFHEKTEKVDPMRNQKLVLIHIDGSAKKLGLCFVFFFYTNFLIIGKHFTFQNGKKIVQIYL